LPGQKALGKRQHTPKKILPEKRGQYLPLKKMAFTTLLPKRKKSLQRKKTQNSGKKRPGKRRFFSPIF